MALKGVKAAGELSHARENALWSGFFGLYTCLYTGCEVSPKSSPVGAGSARPVCRGANENR